MNFDLTKGQWINAPARYELDSESLRFPTEGGTDFWQRSYYGFRNDNAPALLFEKTENFSFTAECQFEYKSMYDQCGLIIYMDSENWFKASVEYENDTFSRLGSVVTNNGYSDWATTDIDTPSSMIYRLSRRGPDFLIENSEDGTVFRQMRIFHLHVLGDTGADENRPVRFGLYACSPLESSFMAEFSHIRMEDCLWKAHDA